MVRWAWLDICGFGAVMGRKTCSFLTVGTFSGSKNGYDRIHEETVKFERKRYRYGASILRSV